jgi:cytochrome c
MKPRNIVSLALALFATASLVPAPAAAQDAPDLKRGKLLYIQCRACHDLAEGEPHKVGPNLFGIFGRAAATAEDFTYSTALKNSKVIWDRASMDRWLEKPSAVVPGNAMAFAGIPNPKDRAALIAYIESETKAK